MTVVLLKTGTEPTPEMSGVSNTQWAMSNIVLL